MLCCPFGPCGDANSGPVTSGIQPWHSDAAEEVQGAFGDQFHPFLSECELYRCEVLLFMLYFVAELFPN